MLNENHVWKLSAIVSILEDCWRLRRQCGQDAHQFHAKLNSQGEVIVGTITVGSGAQAACFFGCTVSELLGTKRLRQILHVLFPQSPTTPYCLIPGLEFLVSIACLLPKWIQFVALGWVQSSLWGQWLARDKGCFSHSYFIQGTVGTTSRITQALKKSQFSQRRDMNINSQNTLSQSVYKGSCEKGRDQNTCSGPCVCRSCLW